MSNSTRREFTVGNDFLDDDSSDGECESNVGSFIQTFSTGDGILPENLAQDVHDQVKESRRKTTSIGRSTIASLPKLLKSSVYNRGSDIKDRADEGTPGPIVTRGAPNRARQMSLHRLDRDDVRLVHTSSSVTTPKQSTRTSHFEATPPSEERERAGQFSSPNSGEYQHTPLPMSPKLQGEHRRNTSESTLADSVINAHLMTLRALESRAVPKTEMSPPYGYTYLRSATTSYFPRWSSSSSQRMAMSPLLSANGDGFAYLPSLFIRTPYSSDTEEDYFTAKSQSQRDYSQSGMCGQAREEYTRLGSVGGVEELGTPYDGHKGNHMLGLNPSEQDGISRSQFHCSENTPGVVKRDAVPRKEGTQSVVWLRLQRYGWGKSSDDVMQKKMIRVIVPGTCSLDGSSGLEKTPTPKESPAPFDDKCFAKHLQAGHRKLVGSWVRRTFGARRLRAIRLRQCSIWSGNPTWTSIPSIDGLLARGDGIDDMEETKSSLTEVGLMKLFRDPNAGEARYAWVHWARQVAASNSSHRPPYQHTYPRVADSSRPLPSMVTAIEFLYAPCTFRILVALALGFLACVMAALLWIFTGPGVSGTERDGERMMGERVGGGMGIGVMVLLMEGVVFWTWIVFS
ncbi:hypothetical protein ACJQWK_06992 [Exserohilum turcicum]|uniref:Uncharacterized protein n=1 Tax=Exserohilum turcicum (strain 28A) TaxID=671987 RepID=R0IIE9_EXST2|nr:uncharacterized protein SETTUDRAFT_20464 [Exserohilum turcica Et28A]EOA84950.1 hypothetical protein SETTUDRAFT_20464 [Exserohilum turcica Et28A]